MQEEQKDQQELSETLFEIQEITVDRGQSPLRIDKFLLDRLQRVSRNRIQNAIKAGSVLVDEKEIKPNFKIKPGHRIKVLLPRRAGVDTGLVPEKMSLDIRYEDDDLMILFKPAGLVVHPGIGNWSGTLVNGLAYHFKQLPVLEGNSDDRVGLVHRIDKNTSGLMVVAKSEYAMSHLAKQFFYHTIQRKYLALIWGEPDELEGTINAHIGRHQRHRKKYAAYPEGDLGKEAITHYKVIEPMYYVSLVECQLETGRTHQIRVHMKHVGHPLFNDDTYDGDRIRKGTVFSKYKSFVDRTFSVMPRQALHAKSLGFEHPKTGERMYFGAGLPDDFRQALELWRSYVSERKMNKKPL